MRRREFVLLCGSAALCCSCGQDPADPGPDDRPFSETFDALDEKRWTTGKGHTLGRSTIDPQNVGIVRGELRLVLPGGTVDGAELRTVRPLSRGTYRALIRVANAPDSVTGFFLYSPPDFANEVDIELYNDPSGRARLTTYSAGKMTRTTEVRLPFDPTAAFHEYAIVLVGRSVEFYADGAVVGAWSDGVPTGAMNLYLNAWYPQWLGGRPTDGDRAVTVTLADFDPR